MKVDKEVNRKEFLDKVKKIASECPLGYDEVLQLYYEKYYDIQSKKPDKHSGYWGTHAINSVRRFVKKNPKVYIGKKSAFLGFRLQERLKEDFEKECLAAGLKPSDMLRDLVEKWVKNKLSGWDIT